MRASRPASGQGVTISRFSFPVKEEYGWKCRNVLVISKLSVRYSSFWLVPVIRRANHSSYRFELQNICLLISGSQVRALVRPPYLPGTCRSCGGTASERLTVRLGPNVRSFAFSVVKSFNGKRVMPASAGPKVWPDADLIAESTLSRRRNRPLPALRAAQHAASRRQRATRGI